MSASDEKGQEVSLLLRRLGMDADMLRNGVRLPMGDEDWNDEQLRTLVTQIKNHKRRFALTNREIAEASGMSIPTFSEFINFKKKGSYKKTAQKLNAWLDRDILQRREHRLANYVPTRAAESMYNMIKYAQSVGMMAVITAPSGSGKTTVLKFAAKKFDAVLVTCTVDMAKRDLLVEISEALGISSAYKIGKLTKGIIEKLKSTGKPLYIDEAHLLPEKVFLTLRSLHDQGEVSVVMAGATEILDRINDKGNGNGQFASRCLRVNLMNDFFSTGPEVGNSLFTEKEVRQVLEASVLRLTGGVNEQVQYDPDAISFLTAVACQCGDGGLRTVTRLVEFCVNVTKKTVITRNDLVSMTNLFFSDESADMVRRAQAFEEQCAKEALRKSKVA